jgi:hypothetical protein
MSRTRDFLPLPGLVLLVGNVFISPALASDIPDKILINGKIITVDENFSIAEAVATRNGKFIAVGKSQNIKSLAGPNTKVIDLQGKTVVPGFIDGHAHMDREGLKFILPSLGQARSINDILEVIKKEVESKKPGDWVVTMPIGEYPKYADGAERLEEKRYPTRWDLDKVAPDNPVYIKGIWYYWSGKPPIVSIANSYALKLAGITRETVAPYPGIEIVTDAHSGEPNGIFQETSTIGTVEYSLMKVVPRFSHEQRVVALKDAMRRYNAVGTTSVYEGHGISPLVIKVYEELWEMRELTVRSYLVFSPPWDSVPGAQPESVLRDWAAYAGGHGLGDHMLKIGGIYAAVGNTEQDDIRRKFGPDPGWAGYSVDSYLPAERSSLYELVLACARNNLRINAITHVTEQLDSYLTVIEQVDREVPVRDRRFVLEHLNIVSVGNQKRIRDLGIVATVVPSKTIAESGLKHTKGLDQDSVNAFVPLRSLVDRKVPFVFGTDNDPISPLHALEAAVTRKVASTGQVIGPDQSITRADALQAITINGAFLTFEEGIKGSIEVGKFADLAVLSADLLTVPADQISDIQVLMTMVGGDIVFQHP